MIRRKKASCIGYPTILGYFIEFLFQVEYLMIIHRLPFLQIIQSLSPSFLSQKKMKPPWKMKCSCPFSAILESLHPPMSRQNSSFCFASLVWGFKMHESPFWYSFQFNDTTNSNQSRGISYPLFKQMIHVHVQFKTNDIFDDFIQYHLFFYRKRFGESQEKWCFKI